MSSKYSALPYFDTQPDVYETPDDPTDDHGATSKDHETDEEREEMEKRGVSVKDVSSRFKSSGADGSNGDFSDRLTKRKKAMYRTFVRRPHLDSSEYEILPKDLILAETPAQKLRRLIYEVKELGQEAELNDQQGTELVAGEIPHKDLLAHVKSLEHELEQISQTLGEGQTLGSLSGEGLVKQTDTGKRLIQQLQSLKVSAHSTADPKNTESATAPDGAALKNTDGDGKTVTYELYYSPENARLHTATKTAELAERLALLEKAVGSTPMQSGASLVGTVEKLEHQVSILVQPRQLEQLSRRLKGLVAEMERVQELQAKDSAASGISPETETKINSLFELVDKIDPLVALAPVLVTRLKGLKGLHTEAAIFSDSVKMISGEQTKISEELKGLEGVSEKLQQSLTENDAAIKNNIELIDGRISEMVDRVRRLGA